MNFNEVRYSPLVVVTVVLLEIIAVLLALPFGKPHLIFIFSLVPILFFLNFFCIRVMVDEEAILVRYGIGLFGPSIPIAAIQDLQVTKATFLSWLYNPSQENVLRVGLRYGGQAQVPIGDPRRMIEAISGRMGR